VAESIIEKELPPSCKLTVGRNSGSKDGPWIVTIATAGSWAMCIDVTIMGTPGESLESVTRRVLDVVAKFFQTATPSAPNA
jgi:hypothetical protein